MRSRISSSLPIARPLPKRARPPARSKPASLPSRAFLFRGAAWAAPRLPPSIQGHSPKPGRAPARPSRAPSKKARPFPHGRPTTKPVHGPARSGQGTRARRLESPSTTRREPAPFLLQPGSVPFPPLGLGRAGGLPCFQKGHHGRERLRRGDPSHVIRECDRSPRGDPAAPTPRGLRPAPLPPSPSRGGEASLPLGYRKGRAGAAPPSLLGGPSGAGWMDGWIACSEGGLDGAGSLRFKFGPAFFAEGGCFWIRRAFN